MLDTAGSGLSTGTLIESLVYEIGLGQVRPNWPGLTTIPAQPELSSALGLGQALLEPLGPLDIPRHGPIINHMQKPVENFLL